jgi:hypothetical protein
MGDLQPLPELDTAFLFMPLRDELIALLRSLAPGDWDAPTVAGAWRVRDVVSHLLDGELRTLAAHRDGHHLSEAGTVQGYADVIALVQRLNAEGVATGRHYSARLLTDLLEVTGGWMSAFVTALDPEAPALFSVAWAGEKESTNRFDTAREYTERWHHQMQIRLAVGERGNAATLLAERYAVPLLETSVRVLPHAYRAVAAADDTAIVFSVAPRAAAAGPDADIADPGWRRAWTIRRERGGWRLHAGESDGPSARVAGSADAWWRLFFNAMPRDDARREFVVEGNAGLVLPLWRARSVMV